uniref:RING-type domain-containing protein n=1 Tax=Amazona collaria TaxID=241587 RepID=A0A8B9FA08_9PSIT
VQGAMGLQLFSRLTPCNPLCPICHDVLGDVTKVIPCGHQFCLGCILQLAEQVVECPLCRKPIENVTFSQLCRLRSGGGTLHVRGCPAQGSWPLLQAGLWCCPVQVLSRSP